MTQRTRIWSRSAVWLAAALQLTFLGADSATAGTAASSGDSVIHVAGADLTIEQRGSFVVGEPEIHAWIERSANIVRQYYGYFPVKRLTLRLEAVAGSEVRNGRTRAMPEFVINVAAGQAVTSEALLHDWVLVHEMIHLALPEVGESHNWLAEGIATYVEGIARVQAGNLTDIELWQEYVAQMPKGLPAAGDRGLDHTSNWARTYWGGALFCLLADVRILKSTQGRAGLQDALRAIGHEGGMAVDENIEHVLAAGDAATGTMVLRDLYAAMKSDPMTPDLGRLWQDLGIQSTQRPVILDDGAPFASVRHRITAPRPEPGSNPNRSQR